MSLLAEVAELASADRRGPRCGVSVLLDRLDPADAKDLTALLADPHVPGTLIARALSNRGHSVKAPALQRHRRNLCGCG